MTLVSNNLKSDVRQLFLKIKSIVSLFSSLFSFSLFSLFLTDVFNKRVKF